MYLVDAIGSCLYQYIWINAFKTHFNCARTPLVLSRFQDVAERLWRWWWVETAFGRRAKSYRWLFFFQICLFFTLELVSHKICLLPDQFNIFQPRKEKGVTRYPNEWETICSREQLLATILLVLVKFAPEFNFSFD